jgi:hypothetical protein
MTRLLLTSVFKPFGVDDAFGVKENVCELMHNQVTRLQGVFSIRSHNRSFGLTMIAANLKVPTTVLDFPTLDEFVTELERGNYTHVGITFIVPNFAKARHMAKRIREIAPAAKIILGGHGTKIPEVKNLIECDEVCVGDGIAFLRRLFGEDPHAPLRHPVMGLDCYRKILGVEIPNTKAVLIPGVGCVNACDFCCTSHFFEGYTPFFSSADELFQVMCESEKQLGLREFFVLDENFLDDPARIGRLRELMNQHGKRYILDIFSSLKAISQYDPHMLFRLGVQFVWIGIESRRSLYAKTAGLDAARIIGGLRDYGISVLASSILFLDHHDDETLWEDVDFTISLEPDFIQFMELAPLPGTALYRRLDQENRLLHEVPLQEWHGQDLIWFRHPHFSREKTKEILDAAFEREFSRLGPSLLRIAATRIRGVAHLRQGVLDPELQARLDGLTSYSRQMRPLLWAMKTMARCDDMRKKVEHVMAQYEQYLGPASLLEMGAAVIIDLCARLETRKFRRRTAVHQPKTYLDRYRQ